MEFSGKLYIGQTSCCTGTKKREHQRHKRLAQPEKSAVAEQSFTQDNIIQFTKILSTKSDYLDHLIMEVIKLQLQLNNMNREEGLKLSNSLKLFIQLLKRKCHISRDSSSTTPI